MSTQTSTDATRHCHPAAAAADPPDRPRHRRLPALRRPRGGPLDTDRDAVGGDQAAKDLNNAAIRQSTSTGSQAAPRPDPVARPRSGSSRRSCSPSAPTSTPSRRPTGAATRSSPTSTLTVSVTGAGSAVTVYKSMASGRSQRVEASDGRGRQRHASPSRCPSSRSSTAAGTGTTSSPATRRHESSSAEWTAAGPRRQTGPITPRHHDAATQPAFCINSLAHRWGSAPEALQHLDTVIVDRPGQRQGHRLPTTSPTAKKGLGGKLRVIDQGNLGGSGGYARGQLESAPQGHRDYAMMMDDDVVCEPESIIRAVHLRRPAKRPTIVGGHMFNLYSRSDLHSLRRDRPARAASGLADPPRPAMRHDFGAAQPAAHRPGCTSRVDVDYNGWCMCLIPPG